MKQVAHVIKRYQCEVCHTEYTHAEQATRCEEGNVEPVLFKKGDRVKINILIFCGHGTAIFKKKKLGIVGSVTAVSRLIPTDDDAINRRLSGFDHREWYGHKRYYTVSFPCPCKKFRQAQFLGPEIKKA